MYLLVLRLWRDVFGPSEAAAVSLSLIMGVVGVGLVWMVARLRFGATAAAVAGLLVALSRFHVHYSQEIRGYACCSRRSPPPICSTCAGRRVGDAGISSAGASPA